MLKQCSCCKKLKDLSNYYKNKSCNDGYNYACKQCHKAYGDHSEKAIKERIKIQSEYNKKYYQTFRKPNRDKNKIDYNVFQFEGLFGTSAVGRIYERIALSIFPESIDVSGLNISSPYDLLLKGFRIDVKMINLNKTRNCWTLVQKKSKKELVDAYLLFCCSDYKIIKIFLLPSNGDSFYLSLNNLDKYKDFEISF